AGYVPQHVLLAQELVDHHRRQVAGAHGDRHLLGDGPQVAGDPDPGDVGVAALRAGQDVLAAGGELDPELGREVGAATGRAGDEEGVGRDPGAVGELQRLQVVALADESLDL